VVAQTFGRVATLTKREQRSYVIVLDRARQRLFELGRADALGRVAGDLTLAAQVLKERAQGSRFARDGRRRIAASGQVQEVAGELGGIDVLVNNAANYETVEFEKITVAQWDAIFASNTRGPFLVSREALPYLKKRVGRIINMGSLGGIRPWATHAHYCSSKAALHMLTQVMAKALAPEIAVNAVAPGYIATPMFYSYCDVQPDPQAALNEVLNATPMGRLGTPDDVAGAALYFASDDSQWATGTSLVVDGGLLCH